MKQTLKLMTLLIVMLCASAQSYAQQDERQKSREELATTQARHIASELALDDSVAQKFIETYCACQLEIWALGPRNNHTTDPEANIENRFERSQKILDIRRKYYEEYRKFLTPEQIDKVYRLEKRMMQRLSRRHNDNQPHRRESRRTPRK